MQRRVVVTGMGVLTAIGNNLQEFWNGLLQGRNGVDTLTLFDPSSQSTRFAAEVKNFSVDGILDVRESNRMDRYTQFAMVAADEAIKDSGLDLEKINSDMIGVVVGSGIGGIQSFENEHTKFIEKGPRRVSPYFVPQMISDIAAGQISIKYHFKGPNYATVSACASVSNNSLLKKQPKRLPVSSMRNSVSWRQRSNWMIRPLSSSKSSKGPWRICWDPEA